MLQNFAAIDIGTNTLRLLIAYVQESRLVRVCTCRESARLGSGIGDTGVLNAEGINNAIGTLDSFAQIINSFDVKSTRAVGTHALRTAANTAEFINLAAQKTGINIEVISGEEEAALTLKGAVTASPSLHSPYAVVDIGGGSTEWIYMTDSISQMSIPIGAVELYDKFFASSQSMSLAIERAREYAITLFKKTIPAISGGTIQLMATGGTATTLAAMDIQLEAYDPDKVQGHTISARNIEQTINTLSAMNADQRAEIKGLEKDRVDIIIPGALILSSLMQRMSAASVVVSDFGILEAIIFELVNVKSHIDFV